MSIMNKLYDNMKMSFYNCLFSNDEIDNNHCKYCGKELYSGKSRFCGTCITTFDLVIDEYKKKLGYTFGGISILFLIKNKAKILSLIKDFGSNVI